jgi:hypothetical protein
MFLSDSAEQNSWFFLTAEELGYDREVLQEAYEFQHRGNILVKLKLWHLKDSINTFRPTMQPTRN